MAERGSGRPVADVAVIGAGICGTTLAAILAREGVRVTVYEREAVAAGASGRNSGVVQRPLDPALVPLYERTVAVYRELAAELPEAGFALPDEPAGLLLATLTPEGLPALAADLEASVPDLGPTILEGTDLRAVEPALAEGVAAIRLPIGFPVVPSKPTYAMASLAERRGARIRLGQSARPAIRDGRAVGVEINGRMEPAGAVVVAAGPWSAGLLDRGGGWRPIRPLWGVVVEVLMDAPPRHVIEEAELDVVVAREAVPDGAFDQPGHAPPAPGFSLVPVGGVSTVGSTFLDDEPDPGAWREPILHHGVRFVPRILDAPIRETRACARPLSADGRPILGPIPWIDDLHICSGHGPWGISTGPGSAALVADVILGRQPSVPSDFGSTRPLVAIR